MAPVGCSFIPPNLFVASILFGSDTTNSEQNALYKESKEEIILIQARKAT